MLIESLKKGIDLPFFQQVQSLPLSSVPGTTICNDERGTNRYIYIIFTATDFWRYDTYTNAYQKLAAPATFAFAAGISITFDPSLGTEGSIWLSGPQASSPYHTFQKYDIATNLWTTKNYITGLSTQFGTDGTLCHTCSAYNLTGDDNAIYLIGGASNNLWKYSISSDIWSVIATLPTIAGPGEALIWTWGYNTDRLYYFPGYTSSSLYYYSILEASWSEDIPYVPKSETFQTGTVYAYDTEQKIYIVKDATHRMYCYQLNQDTIKPFASIPYLSAAAIVGKGLSYVKTPYNNIEYLYYRKHTGYEFWRLPIGWT